MRILIVDHNAVDPLSQSVYKQLGGTGDYFVRVVVPASWFDNYRVVHGKGVRLSDRYEVVPLPVMFHNRTHRLLYWGIRRQLREFRPDIVYVNAEPENFQSLQCAIANDCVARSVFVFSTWRNIDYSELGSPYRLSFLHAFAERVVLRRAYHAIAFTKEAIPIYSRLGFSRMTHISPDVDTTVFTPEPHKARDRGGIFTVGYAGRLHWLKGVDVLLEAVSELPRSFRLLVIGAGPDQEALRARCRSLGLDNRVEWRGAVSRQDMPDALKDMDVLVLPSRTGVYWKEQFGRVLIEAMACGIPVIGSNSGSIPTVIDTAGLVVTEGDIHGFRDAILMLRDDPSLNDRCKERGLTRVAHEFSVPVVTSRYRMLMDSIVNASARSLEV